MVLLVSYTQAVCDVKCATCVTDDDTKCATCTDNANFGTSCQTACSTVGPQVEECDITGQATVCADNDSWGNDCKTMPLENQDHVNIDGTAIDCKNDSSFGTHCETPCNKVNVNVYKCAFATPNAATSCLPGFYGDKCQSACVANAFACDFTTGAVIMCNPGFYKTDLTCTACGAHIHMCDDEGIPYVCVAGYWGASDCSQTCTDAVKFEKCNIADGVGTICRDAKKTVTTDCDTACGTDILSCDVSGDAILCTAGKTGIDCATACGTNITTCDIEGGALTCSAGFHGWSCDKSCSANTQTCKINGDSLTCAAQFNVQGLECVACGPWCTGCQEGKCTGCDATYELSSTKTCVKKTDSTDDTADAASSSTFVVSLISVASALVAVMI